MTFIGRMKGAIVAFFLYSRVLFQGTANET